MTDRFDDELIDPFRWMETPPAAECWLLEQHARSASEHDTQLRDELRVRLAELVATSSSIGAISWIGASLFYTRIEASRRTLWARRDNRDELVLDPETIVPGTTLLAWSVSFDERYIAATLAPAGAEIGAVYICELATGLVLPDRMVGVHNEFSVEWISDRACLYTAIDPSSPDPTRGMCLSLHVLGAATDPCILTDAPIAPGEFPFVHPAAPDSAWLIAGISSARAAMRVYVARNDNTFAWRELASYADAIEDVRLFGDQLYVLAANEAPNRRIDRIDLTSNARTTVIAASNAVIEGLTIARDGVYVRGTVAGRGQLWHCSHDGRPIDEFPLRPGETIARMTSDPRGDGVVVAIESWTEAMRLVRFRDGASELDIVATTPAGYDRIVVDNLDITSFDGESVPLTVLRARELVFDGSRPTLLEAYGGYGMALAPTCDPMRVAWLERGGVYAIAHVRGGGEKGRAWHLAGKGPNKPNGVRDFIACALALCDRGYTRPDRLGATGLSMGAVVIGGALIHAPERFGAVAIHAGLLNPVRYLHGVNGEPQREELGSPEHEADFRALVAMDVYHGVSDATRYPPILLSVGINDERVSPWMTSKLAARLLANHNPVAVRVDHEGHGMTASPAQIASRLADTWAFFATRLGL